MKQSINIIIEKGADAGKVFHITMPNAFESEALLMNILSSMSKGDQSDGNIFRLTSTNEGRIIWNGLIDFVTYTEGAIPRGIDAEDIKDPSTLITIKGAVLSEFLNILSDDEIDAEGTAEQ